MALSISYTEPVEEFTGQIVTVDGTITFDSSYLTGGEAFAPSSIGLSSILNLQLTVSVPLTATELVTPAYDSANDAIQLFWTGGALSSELDEITSATDVSAVVLNFVAKGRV